MFVAGALLAVVGVGVGIVVARREHAPKKTTIVVMATAHGSTTENEHAIAEPLERALSQVKGLGALRSESTAEGVSLACRVDGDDAIGATLAIQAAVATTLPSLPPGCDPPVVRRAGDDGAALFVVAGPPDLGRDLETSSGVASVMTCGLRELRPVVMLDGGRLTATGVDAADVVRALEGAMPTIPGGRIGSGPGPAIRLAPSTPPRSPSELQALVLKTTPDGAQVRLADVAQVAMENDERSCLALSEASAREGSPNVVHRVVLQAGANRKETASRVAERAGARGARLLEDKQLLVVGFLVPPSATFIERQRAAHALITSLDPTIRARGAFATVDAGGRGEVVAEIDAAQLEGVRGVLRDAIRAASTLGYGGVLLSPRGRPDRLRVTMTGPELEALGRDAEQLRNDVGRVFGVGAFVGFGPRADAPEIEASIDRPRAAELGVAPAAVARAVALALRGEEANGVLVRPLETGRAAFATAHVTSARGQAVPLGALVKLETVARPGSIVHVNRQRAVELVWELDRPDAATEARRVIGTRGNVTVDVERAR